jgi:hypothetical protein
MEETFGLFGRDEAEILDFDFDVSDDALEIASCANNEGHAFTLSFCTGLDTCPA